LGAWRLRCLLAPALTMGITLLLNDLAPDNQHMIYHMPPFVDCAPAGSVQGN
jgi:hypothetical protein